MQPHMKNPVTIIPEVTRPPVLLWIATTIGCGSPHSTSMPPTGCTFGSTDSKARLVMCSAFRTSLRNAFSRQSSRNYSSLRSSD
jgi:hypothetical protein